MKRLIKKYGISLISVGNGTASRESEQIIVDLIKELDVPVQYIIVNEAGASVYSASKLATEEFPNFDVGAEECRFHSKTASRSSGRACKNRSQIHWGRTVPA